MRHLADVVAALDIGPARLEDAPHILQVQRAAYRIEVERYGGATLPPMTETLDELTALFDTHTILVARTARHVADGTIVGTVRARVAGDSAHIGRLAVLPSLHGQGVGRALLAAIERSVAPVRRYELFTGHRSDRNLRMYERAGYRRIRSVRESAAVQLVYLEKEVGEVRARQQVR